MNNISPIFLSVMYSVPCFQFSRRRRLTFGPPREEWYGRVTNGQDQHRKYKRHCGINKSGQFVQFHNSQLALLVIILSMGNCISVFGVHVFFGVILVLGAADETITRELNEIRSAVIVW